MSDRTIHAVTADGREIVRYDRSGKWYAEARDGRKHGRQHIDLAEAVRLAKAEGSRISLGYGGGRMFDAAVTKDER